MKRLSLTALLLAFAATVVWLAGSTPSVPSAALPRPSRAIAVRPTCLPDGEDCYIKGYGFWVKLWAVVEEPELSCEPIGSDEVYRLSWVHSFANRAPFVVRIDKTGARHELTLVEIEPPYTVKRRSHRELSRADWDGLIQAVEDVRFWEMPPVSGTEPGNDGSIWVLDGRRGQGYHVIERWSPDPGTFRTLAMRFIRLAGLKDPEPRG